MKRRRSSSAASREWACIVILGTSALVKPIRQGLRGHEYLPRLRKYASDSLIPGAVWRAALESARTRSRPWIGPFYLGGLAMLFNEFNVARAAFTGVAERGHTDAMMALATLETGLGNPEVATQWTERAAAAGDVQGLYSLGVDAYETGDAQTAAPSDRGGRTGARPTR